MLSNKGVQKYAFFLRKMACNQWEWFGYFKLPLSSARVRHSVWPGALIYFFLDISRAIEMGSVVDNTMTRTNRQQMAMPGSTARAI